MSEANEADAGLERARLAAENARRDLLRQLAVEADRLDRDLGDHAERMIERDRRLAEDRVDQEIGRMRRVSTTLSLELHRQLHEGTERSRTLLDKHLEVATAELRARADRSALEIAADVDRRFDDHQQRAMSELAERLDAAERTIRVSIDRGLEDARERLARDLDGRLAQPSARAVVTGGRERLEHVLDRLQAADRRLRESDQRTRRALRQLGELE